MKALLKLIVKKLSFIQNEGVRQAIIYFTSITLLFLLLVIINKYFSDFNTLHHLVGLITVLIIMGLLNNLFLSKSFRLGVPEWMNAIITLTANLIGAVLFITLSNTNDDLFYWPILIPALLFFSFPYFLKIALRAINEIPVLEYSLFEISNLKDIVARINWAEDNTRGIVWEFENLSELKEDGKYWIRTHTPLKVNDIPLSELFKCLLSLHNHNLNPGQPILFDQDGLMYGWRFYYQVDYVFWKSLRPLNPEKSLRENGISFKRFSKNQRLKNIRNGLQNNFKTTTIRIVRSQPIIEPQSLTFEAVCLNH